VAADGKASRQEIEALRDRMAADGKVSVEELRLYRQTLARLEIDYD
jgi:hypothetical protein